MFDDILSQVMKPGRYIGREWNLPKKYFTSAYIKFALCFPDLYEVGMSNLGIRILYGVLNNIPDVSCERVFSPALDLEDVLRKTKQEIFSLETHSKLKSFDIVGFSLGHELLFTNVLNMLDLGLIPLKSSLRDFSYPLIIGGGACSLNPEPMHEFFDLFIIGEAEEALIELMDAYRGVKKGFKEGKIDKQEMLTMFSRIEGVYVPSLYDAQYDVQGRLIQFKPKAAGIPLRIKKRVIKDLDKAYFPMDWIVPFIQIAHDRITVELMRGCPNRCRFCQARQQYFPFRLKTVKNIFDQASEAFKATGYEEIAFGGLSVTDYPQLEELLNLTIGHFKEKCVAVSFPSIKPKNMVGNMSSLIATIKKTGLTFAPEAATEKLRSILGKNFDSDEFFNIMEQAFKSGYQRVKLYFMMGLPLEEESDLEGIIDFAAKVSQIRKKVSRYPAQLNLSINTILPKPHTPFQWFKMLGLDQMKYKREFLKNKAGSNNKIKLSFHNPYMSFLEGVLCRGDRRLSGVILEAFNEGARFDAWEEHFHFEIWEKVFRNLNIDPNFYLRQRPEDELFPWDFLDVGVNKEILLSEFKLIRGQNT